MDMDIGALTGVLLGAGYGVGVVALLTLGYFYIAWDKHKDGSANKDDGQVGVKVVLYSLLLIGLMIAAGAVTQLLAFVFAGASGGGAAVKPIIGHLVTGAGTMAAVFLLFLPRTNAKDYPQVERFTLGIVAVFAGIGAVMSLDRLLVGLLTSAPWKQVNAAVFAALAVNGALMFLALSRFGTMSGWTAPVRPMPMMPPQGFAPQQGYPPQGMQGGYPPQGGMQGGGYPPQGGMQGGGYPPGGGMPPPGGGYPPPGGGYPPR